MDSHDSRIVVYGAGAIGGFVGCLLLAAGKNVIFLVRDQGQIDRYAEKGFAAISSLDTAFRCAIPAEKVREVFTTDTTCLVGCSCVFVGAKRTGNASVHQVLSACGVVCPVVYLQNGIHTRGDLLEPVAYELIESMVSFNVVLDKEEGTVTLSQPMEDARLILDGSQPSSEPIMQHFVGTPLLVSVDKDLYAIKCGKLILNMSNAVNALTGLDIATMFAERPIRLVLAASVEEAQAVFRAHGIEVKAGKADEALLLRWFTTILRLWDWPFMLILGRKLRGRGVGMSSMAQDLIARRVPTEIEYLNGEIIRMAKKVNIPTPVNEALVQLVQQAEVANCGCPGLTGNMLLAAALGTASAL